MKIPIPLRYRLINPFLMCVGLKIIPVNEALWFTNEKGQRSREIKTLGYRLAWWRHWFRIPDQFTEEERVITARMRKNGETYGKRSAQRAGRSNPKGPQHPQGQGRQRR